MAIRGVTLACALLAAAPAAWAADWEFFAGSDQMSVYIDKSSIRPTAQANKAWVKFVYVNEQLNRVSSKRYRAYMALWVLNCRDRTSGSMQGLYYDDAGVNGVVVDSFSVTEKQLALEDVAPGTIAEAALDFVCSHREAPRPQKRNQQQQKGSPPA